MPADSAKPRRPRRRRPAHDANSLRRVPVKYFWVIDEDGQLRRLVFPIQPGDGDREGRPFGEGNGPPDDLPATLKIKPAPGQRRPPKTPTGTLEDHPELFKKIQDILDDPDDKRDLSVLWVPNDRADRRNVIRDSLCRLAREFLGPEQFTKMRERVMKSLASRAVERKGIAADEIERQLLVWRYCLTDPAVRKSRLPYDHDTQRRRAKPVAHDFTALVLKYETERPFLDAETGKPVKDENGRPILVRPPVCDEQGQPILWVPDEHGQPSRPYGVVDEQGHLRPYVAGEPRPRRRAKIVRPPVKLTFR